MSAQKSANQLATSTSPYLLQHKDNPVHWRIWGPEALEEAARDNKPILLSIGYSACHWCHVMAHESFEDEKTAKLMNALYVNIKVDREERPDIDQIYMAAIHLFGEQGGWPLTMFLTPDGKPYWGGTYFPPEARWGRPSFSHVLIEVSRLFHQERDSVDHNTNIITERLAEISQKENGDALTLADLDQTAQTLANQIDPIKGGFKGAPKFPQFAGFELVARAGMRNGQPKLTELYLTTIDEIFNGGIYDHLAGGLSRYSVDENWLVPHFEKMLYDNAQAIAALTFAHQISPKPLYRTRIEEIFGWLTTEMVTDTGAFAASIDADSEGVEGKFYVWNKQEIVDVLGKEDGEIFCSAYDVTPEGNWEGKSILNLSATSKNTPQDQNEGQLAGFRRNLLAARRKRIPPLRDDKVLTDWNGLVITALAKASMVFDEPDWLGRAISVFNAIVPADSDTAHLPHSARGGKIGVKGLASDYANMTAASLVLFEATSEQTYLDYAEAWVWTLEQEFADGQGSFYAAPNSATDLIVRLRAATDDPMPNHNAVTLDNYVRLECFTGNTDYGKAANDLANAFASTLKAQPYGHGSFLNGIERFLNPIEVVITNCETPKGKLLAKIARQNAPPTASLQLIGSTQHLRDGHPASGKSNGEMAQAYICTQRTCSAPISEPGKLLSELENSYKSQK